MSKLLTKLELKVMNILWKLKEAFVKEILESWKDEEKPAYNTISTTIRILEDKGFVDHKAFGRTYQYFPKITKSEYQKKHIGSVLENVFSGSASNLISALIDQSKIDEEQLEELKAMIERKK